MPLAFVLIFGGILLAYMGFKNESLGGIINDQHSPISKPNASQQAASIANSSPVAGGAISSPVSGSLQAFPSLIKAGSYLDPLAGVVRPGGWERTDQGVDLSPIPGKPIKAPGRVKIMGIIPNWYNGQPYIWWKLLDGPDAGKYQYAAEQITNLAKPGSILQAGQPIAYAANSGTGIEFGWASASGKTLAQATTGYTEGAFTKAGISIRAWLNALGAGAGANRH